MPNNKGKIERMKLHKRYLYSCFYGSSILSCFAFTLNGKNWQSFWKEKMPEKQIPPHVLKDYIAAGMYPFERSITVILSLVVVAPSMSCSWGHRLQQNFSSIDMTQSSVISLYHNCHLNIRRKKRRKRKIDWRLFKGVFQWTGKNRNPETKF